MAHGGEVVRHQQVGDVVLGLDVLQEVHHLRPDRHVERRDRLVEHDQLGPRGECCRKRHALALAAAELVRILLRLLGPQADLQQQFAHPRVDPRPVASIQALTISNSAMMRPTFMRGLSDDQGSWNTACTLAR